MADFYIRSAKALDRVLRDECSVKAAAAPFADSGRVLAILINALAYRSALTHAIQQSKVAQLEDRTFTLMPMPKKGAKGDSVVNKTHKRPVVSSTYPSKEAFLLVLCHDLLFQNRGIQAAKTWAPKLTLEKYRTPIHAALVKLQIKQGKARIADLRVGALYQELSARIPRWIRINTLRATRQQVLDWLQQHHWTRVDNDSTLTMGSLHKIKDFAVSDHVPNLLAFHSKATSLLLQTELYKDNWIVMQDLASCFPAYVLDPPFTATVIDATSAPGNKTCHLAAIMHEKTPVGSDQNKGRVIAFERDEARYKILTKRLAAVGATTSRDGTGHGNVEPQRRDFLTTQPEAYPQVTHMLLDPSCSGSGIVNRLDWLKEDDDVELEPELESEHSTTNNNEADSDGDETKPVLSKRQLRLRQLSEFQTLMIRHAFKFPALERLVYSTCSVNAEENEQVVMRALASDEAAGQWILATTIIPSWTTRGMPEECGDQPTLAECMIRCIPGGRVASTDGGSHDPPLPYVEASNGFFVACFVRKRDTASSGKKRSLSPEASDEVQQQKRAKKALANRKKKQQKKASLQKHKLDTSQ